MLRVRPYGEVDKIATFLTRDFGKLTGIAKGAKNSRRRFPNCLEPFARVRVYFRTRPGATLAFLEHCELTHPATGMATPSRFAYGSYLLELVDRLTHEADPIGEVYDLLEAGLTDIENGSVASSLLRAFEMQLLRDLGYAPPFEQCRHCQRSLQDFTYGFLDERGGFLCESCGRFHRASERFAVSTFATLYQLQSLPLARSREQTMPPDTAREAAELSGKLLAVHLNRPLRSLELIATLSRQRT